MQRNTPWGAGSLGQFKSLPYFIYNRLSFNSGPICNTTGPYALTGAFFDFVCQENGFDKALFYGSKTEYLSFMKSRFNRRVGNYFETLYEYDKDLPEEGSSRNLKNMHSRTDLKIKPYSLDDPCLRIHCEWCKIQWNRMGYFRFSKSRGKLFILELLSFCTL